MKKTKKKKLDNKNDLGFTNFYCKHCEKDFEVSWLEIFSLQDATHGYVGFNLQEEYIACPICGENANNDNDSNFVSDQNLPISH